MPSRTAHRPLVVFIGGGTGAPELLVALRARLPAARYAIVVPSTDTGRSTGVARRTLRLPAPGDLRHCISTLAGPDSEWAQVSERRLQADNHPDLDGMAVGNLILGALTQETGNIGLAGARLAAMMGVSEDVLPVSVEDIHLGAVLEGGESVTGEYEVRRPGKAAIKRLFINGEREGVWEPTRDVLVNASHVVLGPGSLWTSVGAVLTVRGVREALATSSAKIIFVCNTTTQPGQTDQLDYSGHVDAVTGMVGRPPDFVVANTGVPPSVVGEDLEANGLSLVQPDLQAGRSQATETITIAEDLLARTATPRRLWQKMHTAYHDMPKVARILADLIEREPDRT